MTDKLARRVEENRQMIETNINKSMLEVHSTKAQQKSLIRIGAISAVGRIAQTLTAQTIRGLQTVRDEKDYEALGFTRFDDFLDNSEISPMSYRQFNDREKLLLREGDEVFDLLNSLKISHRQRRMLGAGNVQIDETKGTVIIKAPVGNGEIEAEKTEEIELSDRTRLLQTLSALADQAAQLNVKTRKQKEKIERGEKEVENLQKKLDEAMLRPGETKIYDLCLSACNTLNMMAEMVKSASDLERAHVGLYLNSINAAVARVEHAHRKPLAEMSEAEFSKHVAKKMKGYKGNADDLAELTAQLSDDDLVELMD